MIRRKFITLVLCGLMAITGIAMAGNYAGWFYQYGGRKAVLPTASEEFRKLYERFMQQGSTIDMSGDILLYDGENRSGAKERNSFHFIKNGMASYSQLGYIQNYCNGKLLLQLDTVNRLIIVARAGDQSAAQTMSKQPSVDMLF